MAGMTPEAYRAIAQADAAKAIEDPGLLRKLLRENPTEHWKSENQAAYPDAIQPSLVEAPGGFPGPLPTTASSSPVSPAAPPSLPPASLERDVAPGSRSRGRRSMASGARSRRT